MEVKIIALEDDLDKLISEINHSSWDAANDMCEYDIDGIKAYLERQDTIFLACYENSSDNASLLGIASSRIEIKPYGKQRWLYVDEVDVCANQRRRGVGKLIMQKFLDIAQNGGCDELWLGTEIDNYPANTLYQSLDPDEISSFVGYTYET